MSAFDFSCPDTIEYVYRIDKTRRVRMAEQREFETNAMTTQTVKNWYVRREIREGETWAEDPGSRREFKKGLDAVKHAMFLFKTNEPITNVEVIRA